jgi:hypothetical protein
VWVKKSLRDLGMVFETTFRRNFEIKKHLAALYDNAALKTQRVGHVGKIAFAFRRKAEAG